MGHSRPRYLSRGTNQARETARTGIARSISDPAKDELLGPQRAVGNQAVTRLLRPGQVPAQQSGRALDPATRDRMESLLRADFSRVRVHTDAEAAQSASVVNALAYTAGWNIVFAAGQYAPETHAGRRMLAHELTHVVQQSPGPVDGSAAAKGIILSAPGDRFEREAEMTAERVISGNRGLHRISEWIPNGEGSDRPLNIQRSNGSTASTAPSPPAWLGSQAAGAVHVKGDIWDVKIPSLGGDRWVGPYDKLSNFINEQGYAGQLEAAHIIGREHLLDISSGYPGDQAPCVAVEKNLHATWTKQTTDLQKYYLGGRTTPSADRPVVTPKEIEGLYNELYSGHPELREFSRNIVSAPTRGMPKPTPAMPAPESPMEAHQGTAMPKPTPAIPAPEEFAEITSGNAPTSAIGEGAGLAKMGMATLSVSVDMIKGMIIWSLVFAAIDAVGRHFFGPSAEEQRLTSALERIENEELPGKCAEALQSKWNYISGMPGFIFYFHIRIAMLYSNMDGNELITGAALRSVDVEVATGAGVPVGKFNDGICDTYAVVPFKTPRSFEYDTTANNLFNARSQGATRAFQNVPLSTLEAEHLPGFHAADRRRYRLQFIAGYVSYAMSYQDKLPYLRQRLRQAAAGGYLEELSDAGIL